MNASIKKNIVIYYLSWPYKKYLQSGIIWNDKDLKIRWSVKKPIISIKDFKLKKFKEVIKNFKKN